MANHQPNRPFRNGKNDIPPGFDLLPKLVNGGIAGIIGTALMFPLDLAKTRIQNQYVGPNGERMYKSLRDCLKKIVKYEGKAGLYRGSFVALILIAPEKAVKLTANDYARVSLKVQDVPGLSLPREVLAGTFAGFTQSLLTTPMDLLKIQLQDEGRVAAVNHTAVKRISATAFAVDLIKTKGFFEIYRGHVPTAFRNVLFSVFYFPLFFNIDALGSRMSNVKESHPYWSFFSGCFAGSIAAAFVTPLDVIKTRMQRIELGEGEIKYSGTIDAFVKILKQEGPTALMRGNGIRMLVIAPLFGIFQTVYNLGVGEYLFGR